MAQTFHVLVDCDDPLNAVEVSEMLDLHLRPNDDDNPDGSYVLVESIASHAGDAIERVQARFDHGGLNGVAESAYPAP